MNEQPPTIPNSNDKLFVVLCHLSVFLGVGLILPLIVYLVKKDESEFVAFHAKESLNFHLSVLIYGIVCAILVFVVIGAFLLMILGVAVVVLAVIAAVKSSAGEHYRYPLTIRFIN
jgi:uncharacterized Tic20 family protein